MKFCPVVPPALVRILPNHLDVGDFAFAPYCLPGSRYSAMFENDDEMRTLVVDCPIYEGLEALEPYALKKVEQLLKPMFIIVPDIRHNTQATLVNFDRYTSVLGDAATGVLQGTTWKELEKCAKAMAKQVRKFAIPKDVMGRFGISRFELIEQLLKTDVLPQACEIHLLGGIWPYYDEKRCGEAFKQVKSFDSAEPFNAAIQGLTLKAEPPPRWDSWIDIDIPPLRDGLFHRNIQQVIKWSQAH